MKHIQLITILVLCSCRVLAETTVEMIQQRAESGDAAAQTLLGFMTYSGYKVPADKKLAEQWYQKAADQGDSFAQERVDMINSSAANRKNASKIISSVESLYLSKEELEKKVSSASSAEYIGSMDMDELILGHDKYVGKVIELKFQASSVSTMVGENPYMFVYGRDFGGGHDRLMLCGQEALEWAMGVTKKGYGTTSTVYALVEEKGLIALGERKRKVGDGYTYSW